MPPCRNDHSKGCFYAQDHAFKKCSFAPGECPFISPGGKTALEWLKGQLNIQEV